MVTIPNLPAAIAGNQADLLAVSQSDGDTHALTPAQLVVSGATTLSQIGAAAVPAVTQESANFTVTSAQFGTIFNVTAAGLTATLPTPIGNEGAKNEFWNSSTGTLTLSIPTIAPTQPLIGGPANPAKTQTLVMPAGSGVRLASDGTNWLAFLTTGTAGYAVFTSSGTLALPPWATLWSAVLVAGGPAGAPGGTIATGQSGSGGGSGGSGFKLRVPWQPVALLSSRTGTVTVGAGAPVCAVGATPGTGGQTTIAIGGLTYVAPAATYAGATAGSQGAASSGGASGNIYSWGASAATMVYYTDGVACGGMGSTAVGAPQFLVSGAAYRCRGAPSFGGSGGGLNAGVFQPGSSSGVAISTGGSPLQAAGGTTDGAAGSVGASNSAWVGDGEGAGGGGGAGSAAGVGGAGGTGGFPGGGGGGGGSGPGGGGTGGGGGNGVVLVRWV